MPKIILNLTEVTLPGVENSNRFEINIEQEGIYLSCDQAISLLVNTANSLAEYLEKSKTSKNGTITDLHQEQSQANHQDTQEQKRLDNDPEPNTINPGDHGSLQQGNAPGGKKKPDLS